MKMALGVQDHVISSAVTGLLQPSCSEISSCCRFFPHATHSSRSSSLIGLDAVFDRVALSFSVAWPFVDTESSEC